MCNVLNNVLRHCRVVWLPCECGSYVTCPETLLCRGVLCVRGTIRTFLVDSYVSCAILGIVQHC